MTGSFARALFLFCCLSVSVPAYPAGGSGSVFIKSVIIAELGSAWLVFDSAVPNPDGCGNSTRVRLGAAGNEGTIDRMYATALTAKGSGTPVSLWMDGCHSAWNSTYPVAINLTLDP